MGITLPEYAKMAANNGQTLAATIIDVFAGESEVLAALPFDTIAGGGYAWGVESALPGMAFRGINGSYTASTGVVQDQFESLKIAGGDLSVDIALVKMYGVSRLVREQVAKARAISRQIGYYLIEGMVSATSPYEFDGIKRRVPITGSNAVQNHASGAGLSLIKLDEAIDTCERPTHIVMNLATRRNLGAFLRGSSTALVMQKDEYGRPTMTYRDLPILAADKPGDQAALQFNDATTTDSGAGSNTTSVFVASIGSGGWHGIQNSPIDIRELGEQQSGTPAHLVRAEWLMSHLVEHSRGIKRIYNVTNATAVA